MSTGTRDQGRPTLWSRAVYQAARIVLVGLSRIYFPGTVTGRENLPSRGAYLVAPVHRSYVDWLLVARISRRRLRFIVKDEVWRSKVLGSAVEAVGGFPVNRSGADREALERCRTILEGGEPLVMFPEGSRRSGPRVEALRDGVSYLALRSGVPIVPVGIGGSEAAMPKGSSFPRPRRIDLVIGHPVRADPLGPQDDPAPDRDAGATPGASRRRRLSRQLVGALSDELRDAIQEAFDLAQERTGSKG